MYVYDVGVHFYRMTSVWWL